MKILNRSAYFTRIVFSLLLISCLNLTLAQVRFEDDFSGDLSGWDLINDRSIEIAESNDPAHGKVLVLNPNERVHALIKNSEKWGPLKIEAQILFPDKKHNYFGLIYNYTSDLFRTDYGSLYIKGNGSYIRANPWRDGNASRLLYEEFKTPLKGDQSIIINKWHNIKAEIVGNVCHFYVGDMSVPKVTFDLYENSTGAVGFEPRVTGWPVWIDNVKVTSITEFNYEGPNIPNIEYEPDSLISEWESIGPFRKHIEEIEHGFLEPGQTIKVNDNSFRWEKFNVDKRGAVITGKITEYRGERSLAYFRTIIESEKDSSTVLHFSTTDEMSMWVNGNFYGFIYRDGYISLPKNDWNAWYDFWKEPKHAGRRIPIDLKAGKNEILLRVKNGQFASGGFFVRNEFE